MNTLFLKSCISNQDDDFSGGLYLESRDLSITVITSLTEIKNILKSDNRTELEITAPNDSFHTRFEVIDEKTGLIVEGSWQMSAIKVDRKDLEYLVGVASRANAPPPELTIVK